VRYRDAILWGFENLRKLPISTRRILGIQKKLIPTHDTGYRKIQFIGKYHLFINKPLLDLLKK
jgi:hypothetical protein